MAANEIRIQMEEKLHGECPNIAYPRTSSSPSSSNTHIQPQALGNNCNNICNPQMKNLEEDLVQLSQTSSYPNSWSIFKVPYGLRQVNEKAYEPKVISIGPYHHGKDHLKKMEIIKKNCLSRIIGESMDRSKEFVKAMRDMEEDVRKCYPEALPKSMNSADAFVKMMILDGCFIVSFFQEDDSRYLQAQIGALACEVYYDLLLLENQLPFSVLCKLNGIINMPNVEMSAIDHVDQMIKFARKALSRLSHVVPGPVIFPKKFLENINELQGIKHLLGLVHASWIPYPAATGVQGQGSLSKLIRCARELEKAGIKFVKKGTEVGRDEGGLESSLFDIDFTVDAKLKIPSLEIEDDTELILRNFMAYEQFIPSGEPTYVCDYVKFMDNLIDSGEDVQLLCHSGVIVNWLGNDEAVAQMFNKLHDTIYMSEHSFYYKKTYDEVNEHCQKKCNVWKAKLMKDYFNYPWSLISVIAAAVLLLLTIVQTIFSVLAYVHTR